VERGLRFVSKLLITKGAFHCQPAKDDDFQDESPSSLVFHCSGCKRILLPPPAARWSRGAITLPARPKTNVPPQLTNAVDVAAGLDHCLALRDDGTVVAWGDNTYGQTNLPMGLTNVAAIAAGDNHSLALLGDGPLVLHAPLTNPIWSTNGFSVSLPTQSGRVYVLEYKNSLTDSHWTALPSVAGSGRMQSLIDSTSNASQRFYRVQRW
jgi:hypothetical protein